jgi:hypothetical protein
MRNKINKSNNLKILLILGLVVVLIVTIAYSTHTLNLFTKASELSQSAAAVEGEDMNLSGLVTKETNDATASNNSYIEFHGASVGYQPQPPYYATFFYPWSQNPNTDGGWSYWDDHSNAPPTTWFSHYLPDPNPSAFDPTNELYSSNNNQIMYWQLSKLKEAKQQVGISSWWGQNHKTDVTFRKFVTDVMNRADNPYPNFRWTLYYEKESTGDPSVSEIATDLNYIYANYANQPSYFKISGRPVIFVYAAANDTTSSSTCDASNTSYTCRWHMAAQQAQGNFYVVLKVFSGYQSANPQPDSWHQYAPAARSGGNLTSDPYYFVSPGFWLDDGSAVRLARDTDPTLPQFRQAVQHMANAPANVIWRLTETWNEWGEGSSVEPGVQTTVTNGREVQDPNGVPFQNKYIDVLNQYLPAVQ